MSDKEHLQWIYARMVYQHGEDKGVDYMLRFEKIADNLHDKAALIEKVEGLCLQPDATDGYKSGCEDTVKAVKKLIEGEI